MTTKQDCQIIELENFAKDCERALKKSYNGNIPMPKELIERKNPKPKSKKRFAIDFSTALFASLTTVLCIYACIFVDGIQAKLGVLGLAYVPLGSALLLSWLTTKPEKTENDS